MARLAGKKIDTWQIRCKDGLIPVVVRMDAGTGTAMRTRFLVDVPDYEISLAEYDLDLLKAKITEALRDKTLGVWHPCYLYEMTCLMLAEDRDEYLTLESDDPLDAKDTADFNLDISVNDILVDFTKDKERWKAKESRRSVNPTRDGIPGRSDEDEDEFNYNGSLKKVVRATPENLQRLQALREGLRLMAAQLQDYVHSFSSTPDATLPPLPSWLPKAPVRTQTSKHKQRAKNARRSARKKK